MLRMRSRIWAALTSLELAVGCLGARWSWWWLHLARWFGTWRAVSHHEELVCSTELADGPVDPHLPRRILIGLVPAANLRRRSSGGSSSPPEGSALISTLGVVLLVAGEFVSGAFQVDMQMAIEEGQTVGFLESPRELELALVDVTDPARRVVAAIPDSRRARGGSFGVPGTALELRVKRYFRNAAFARRAPADPPVVTAGVGTEVAARERPPVTADDQRNSAAAFVEPTADGRSYGTWLVSNVLASPQSFAHGGRRYALGLRPRRQALGYSLTLKDFRHDLYPGTDIPRNFSSLVHLSNRSTGEERDVLISMNQPLRYDGQAFYQSSFGKNDTLSILQVVRNPGWLLPYLSASLVAAGLLLHFGISRAAVARPRRHLKAARPCRGSRLGRPARPGSRVLAWRALAGPAAGVQA
jgi:hypothetical protein